MEKFGSDMEFRKDIEKFGEIVQLSQHLQL